MAREGRAVFGNAGGTHNFVDVDALVAAEADNHGLGVSHERKPGNVADPSSDFLRGGEAHEPTEQEGRQKAQSGKSSVKIGRITGWKRRLSKRIAAVGRKKDAGPRHPDLPKQNLETNPMQTVVSDILETSP